MLILFAKSSIGDMYVTTLYLLLFNYVYHTFCKWLRAMYCLHILRNQVAHMLPKPCHGKLGMSTSHHNVTCTAGEWAASNTFSMVASNVR